MFRILIDRIINVVNMTRQQHGYLNGCPVTGLVEQIQVAGQVTLRGRVHLIHPHHQEKLQSCQTWIYTGTCRDVDGGFLYVSEPVKVAALTMTSAPEPASAPLPSEDPGGWILERCG